MKICAVIVTYGDRFYLLKRVIESCFREGISKIIVVDNSSEENSRKQLEKMEVKNPSRLKVVYLNRNTGSAGGYKRGLQEAYKCKKCKYILTLDDDNVLLNKFLYEVKKKIEYLNDETAILTNRIDKKLVEKNLCTKPVKNSFLGFHIKYIFYKIIFKKKRKSPTKIDVAPYGGLLFSKGLLDNIGYPNERFFVYVDDFEWTYKIPKIFYLENAKIKDIEKNTINKSGIRYFFHKTQNQLYYGVRNRIIWEKQNFVNNKLIYTINKFVYLTALKFLHPFNERWSILKKALEDAK